MIVTLLKALMIGIVTVPLSLLAVLAGRLQRNGRMFHAIGRGWSGFILWMYGIRVTIRGTEFLDPSKQYIYVSNHASMFDIPAVLTVIPDQIRIVFKREITRVPFFGWAMKYGSYVIIDRAHAKDAMKSLEKAAEKISEGQSVLLFAEGTRTMTGKLQPFKRGAFTLAVKTGVPVVPVAINNTFGILPKGSKNVRPRDITIVLDKPIAVPESDGKEVEVLLMNEVHKAIEKNYIEQS